MSNHFQGTKENPYHISIGAVVMNKDGKICHHYFDKKLHTIMGDYENIVLLMRETIEENETIEQCLHRGLMEEFGMKAELKSYIGSIVSRFEITGTGVYIEKTTLYFLCDFISQDDSLRAKDDVESVSVLQWSNPEDLIIRMKEQGKRLGREDADESSVMERITV